MSTSFFWPKQITLGVEMCFTLMGGTQNSRNRESIELGLIVQSVYHKKVGREEFLLLS